MWGTCLTGWLGMLTGDGTYNGILNTAGYPGDKQSFSMHYYAEVSTRCLGSSAQLSKLSSAYCAERKLEVCWQYCEVVAVGVSILVETYARVDASTRRACWLQNVVDTTRDEFLAHRLDTVGGQSGSPLYQFANNNRQVSCHCSAQLLLAPMPTGT